MLSIGSVSHKLALAAVPCLLLGAQAAHASLEVRDGEALLFAQGGPQLDDIAIIDPGKERDERASIVAQCLIATRKLNSSWISTYFENYDGEAEVKADKTMVVPHWFKDEPIDTEKTYQVTLEAAKKVADSSDLSFGSSETAPWWPFAVLSGLVKAGIMKEGWYKDGNQHASSEIAADVLRLITGYQALNHPPPEDKDRKELEKSAFTPVLLRLDFFDLEKKQRSELLKAPKDLRWEQWVTVMSYDDATKVLEYATSFHGPEEELSQWIHIDDLPINKMVTLDDNNSFGGDRAGDIRTSTQAPASLPTEPA